MIAVNQDPAGQGFLLKEIDKTQVWIKILSDSSVVVLFLNLDTEKSRTINLNLSDIGFSGKIKMRDLITKVNKGSIKKTLTRTLDSHACSLLLVTKN